MADINSNIQVNVVTNITQIKLEAEKAKTAYSELKGNLEAASAAVNLLSGTFGNLGKSSKVFGEIQNTISGLISTVSSLSTVMTALESNQVKAAASAGKLTVAQKAVNVAMKAVPALAVISGISTLISGIGNAISALFSKKSATEKATEALEEYEKVAARVGRTLSIVNGEERNEIDRINNKYDQQIRKAKEYGASQAQLAKIEFNRQKEITGTQIKFSKERSTNLDEEIAALKDSIGKQQKVMDGCSKSTKEFIEKVRMIDEDTIFDGIVEEYDKQNEALQQQQDKLQVLINLKNQEANAQVRVNGALEDARMLYKDAEASQEKDDTAKKKEDGDRWRKKNADNAVAELDVAEKLALSKLEVERNFEDENFAAKQQYEQKVFETQQEYARKRLEALYANGQITLREYNNEKDLLDANRAEFNNEQLQNQEKYNQSLLKQLQNHQKQMDKMTGDAFKLQRMEITEEYEGMIKNVQAFMKMMPKDSPEYKMLADDIEKISNKMNDELKELEKKEQDTKLQDKLSALDEEYEKELEKLANNKAEQLKLEREHLEKVKRLKLEADPNADTGKEDKDLAANSEASKLADIQARAAQELAAEGLTAKKRYQIKRKYLEEELELLKDKGKENTAEFEAKGKEIADLDEAFQEERFKRIMEYAGKAKEVMSSIFEFSNAQDEAKLQKATEQNEQEKQQLQAQLDANLISKDEYNKKVKLSDDKLAKEQAKVKRKQAIQDKASAMFDSIINTAVSISASSKVGLPLAIPFTAMAAALGALQLATIAAQPIPKAAKGRYIRGASHALGGVPIEAEGGEMIINKRSASMFAPLLSAINEVGGGVPFVSSYSDGGFAMRDYQRSSSQGMDMNELAGVVKGAVQEVKIFTAIEDINDGNKKYTAVTDSSKF